MVFWRIVRQYERMVVLRWGKFLDVRGPGLRIVIPFVDQPYKVDLREQVDRVPTQKYITSDNVVVDMDFVIYYRCWRTARRCARPYWRSRTSRGHHQPVLCHPQGGDWLHHALGGALGTREDARPAPGEDGRGHGRWGIKVSQVEINEIDPPPGVKAAMEREKSAAAIKTAEITESEGARQAAINRAEGEKQAAILRAEGSRQSEILTAEGDQQAAILRADGFSTALDRINSVAQEADARTMSLQYFDTLKQARWQPRHQVHLPYGVHEHAPVVRELRDGSQRRQGRRVERRLADLAVLGRGGETGQLLRDGAVLRALQRRVHRAAGRRLPGAPSTAGPGRTGVPCAGPAGRSGACRSSRPALGTAGPPRRRRSRSTPAP